MHYVDSALVMLLDSMDFEIKGLQAQKIYRQLTKNDFTCIRVIVNEHILVIPRESIAYIRFEPNKRANQLQKEIDKKWKEIYILTGLDDDDDGDWYVRDNVTYLGYRKVSTDPRVADLLIDLEQLQEQLEAALPDEDDE